MRTTTINGIIFKGPDSMIKRVCEIKENENYLDLVQEAILAQSEGKRVSLRARVALADFEYQTGSLFCEDIIEPDDTDTLLCKYAGVHYLFPNQKRALIKRIKNEIMAHWKGDN